MTPHEKAEQIRAETVSGVAKPSHIGEVWDNSPCPTCGSPNSSCPACGSPHVDEDYCDDWHYCDCGYWWSVNYGKIDYKIYREHQFPPDDDYEEGYNDGLLAIRPGATIAVSAAKLDEMITQFDRFYADAERSDTKFARLASGYFWEWAKRSRELKAALEAKPKDSMEALTTDRVVAYIEKFYLMGWNDRDADEPSAKEHAETHALIMKVLLEDEQAEIDTDTKEHKSGTAAKVYSLTEEGKKLLADLDAKADEGEEA